MKRTYTITVDFNVMHDGDSYRKYFKAERRTINALRGAIEYCLEHQDLTDYFTDDVVINNIEVSE